MRGFSKGWRDDLRLLPWLRARVPYYRGWKQAYDGVRAVAVNLRMVPGTLDWLKRIAADDGDWVLRHVATQELQRGWKDDEVVMQFLRERGHDIKAPSLELSDLLE